MEEVNVNLRDNSVETHVALLSKDEPRLEKLLAVYPEEQFEKLLVNRKKLDKVLSMFDDIASYSVVNSMIMRCEVTCPFYGVCILAKNEMAPTGYPCPVEKKIVSQITTDVVDFLKIDANDPIEMELLWDLIDTKLLDMRSSGMLKDGMVTQKITTDIGKMHNENNVISPALEIKLELKKLKHSIIDSFVATRRAKKKYGMQNDGRSLEDIIRQGLKSVDEAAE